MINPEKYATKIMVNNPNGYLLADYIRMIEVIQKDAYNQGVIDSAENVTTKQVKVEYTGVRAGGFYYVTDVDKESILKLKK